MPDGSDEMKTSYKRHAEFFNVLGRIKNQVMDFCSTSNQITASSAGIALGAFAGLYFVPNKVLGAFGGMLAGGIVGGAIISQICKK